MQFSNVEVFLCRGLLVLGFSNIEVYNPKNIDNRFLCWPQGGESVESNAFCRVRLVADEHLALGTTVCETRWSSLDEEEVRLRGISGSSLGTAREWEEPPSWAIEVDESEGIRCFER